ncbi:DUF63 family protein [Candidatus Micrarchaeota archaeon]|nr:DUF63 family protein [Candidatus Micrarchaeota archaeon]
MGDFIDEFFIQPLANPSSVAPYNWVNTLVFAGIALFAIYVIYAFLERKKVAVDEGFLKTILAFTLFGGALRVVVDAQILPRQVSVFGLTAYPFVTPLIYVLIFLLLALTTIVFYKLERGFTKEFYKKTFLAGLLLALICLIPLAFLFKNFLALLPILVAGVVVWLDELIAGWRSAKNSLFERLAVFGQVLDGAATFVGVTFFGYSEQHVVGNILFGLGTPALFLLVKIAVVLAIVEYLRAEKNSREKNFVLTVIMIVGLAPGLRDLLRILAGV